MLQDIKQTAIRAISRLNNVLGRGILNRFTYGKRSKANVSLFDDEKYDDIEYANDWGFMSYPPCDGNTELIIAFLRGQRDNGTVLRSFNRPSSPLALSNVTLQEGECIYYNKIQNTYIYLQQDGTILIKSDKKITGVNKNNSFTFDGDKKTVTVVGDQDLLIETYASVTSPFRTGVSTTGQALNQNKVNSIDLNPNTNCITITSNNAVLIDAPNTYITGNLTVNGDVLDNARGAHLNTNNVRSMRTIYNGHTHNDPQGGTVAAPNQPM